MKYGLDKQEIVILTLAQVVGLVNEQVKLTVTKILNDPGNFPYQEQEELLDIHQVAELLKTTTQNVHAKKRAGQIPFVRFGGRVLFKKSEVIASLKSIRINGKKAQRS